MRIQSVQSQLRDYVGENVILALWVCEDYEDDFEVKLLDFNVLGDLVVEPTSELDEGCGYGYLDDSGKHAGKFIIEADKVCAAKKGRPATDPEVYATEAELATAILGCEACEAPAGTPCEQEVHAKRVDMLRSLRAYCKGAS